MSAKVAIIGRPNVGKSTLFNRLVGRKLALVDDQPGVTRDRREGEARLGDLAFTVVDTAGLEEGDEARSPGACARRPRRRSPTATRCCSSSTRAPASPRPTGISPQAVRRAGKPIILVANKAEGAAGRDGRLRSLRPRPRRADRLFRRARRGPRRALRRARRRAAARARRGPRRRRKSGRAARSRRGGGRQRADSDKPLRIAVLGRPNAGKSTLLNRILGEERLLDRAGARPDARQHRHRDRAGAAGKLQAVRHRGPAPARARGREAGEARRRRRAARGEVRRSRRPAARRDDPVREAGPDARRSGRARGPRAGDRPQQMGPRRKQERQGAGVARRGRPAAAATARGRASFPSRA